MSKWPLIPLGEICSTSSGGTPSRSNPEYFGGEVLWIKSGDLTDGEVIHCDENITDAALRNSSAKLFPKGTVLLAMYGATVGKLGMLEVDAATNQAVCGISAPESLDRWFLFFFLLSQRQKLISLSAGGAQPNISQKIVRELLVPVPPLPEQRRIVDLLSRAEGIVRLRREAEKKAAELIPALFLHMFSHINPAEYQRAETLCEFITKGTTPKATDICSSNDGSKTPFLKVLHITDDGRADFDRQPTFVSQALHHGLLARSRVKPNDVLMNIVGPPLGRICLVSDSYSEWNINQALAIFRARASISPIFLFYALRSPLVLPNIFRLPVGVRQLNISLEQCRNIALPVPPTEMQQQFVENAEMIRSIQSQQSAATAKAQATFDALLADAFKAG